MQAVAVVLGFVFYHIPLNFVGVQNRFGAIFSMTALLGFASLTAIELCMFADTIITV